MNSSLSFLVSLRLSLNVCLTTGLSGVKVAHLPARPLPPPPAPITQMWRLLQRPRDLSQVPEQGSEMREACLGPSCISFPTRLPFRSSPKQGQGWGVASCRPGTGGSVWGFLGVPRCCPMKGTEKCLRRTALRNLPLWASLWGIRFKGNSRHLTPHFKLLTFPQSYHAAFPLKLLYLPPNLLGSSPPPPTLALWPHLSYSSSSLER